MRVTNEEKNNYCIITAEGSLSVDNMKKFENLLNSYQSQDMNIVIDMSKVTYIDSSALGIILFNHTKLLEKNKKMVLTNVKRDIYQMFTITGLTNRLKIVLTLEEAENYINS